MFEYQCATEVIFGIGSLDRLADKASRLGRRPMLVCGRRSLEQSGWLIRILNDFKRLSLDVTLFNDVPPNPVSGKINDAIYLAARNRCDLIIGVGGGSVIDSAKAIAVGLPYGEVDNLVGMTLDDVASAEALPIIAVPTTAGTGSEVTKGAIVYSEARRLKSGIRGLAVLPKVAIIDPRLSLTLDPLVTVETAFDALTHSIESYFARKANPICQQQSLVAINLIRENLPVVMRDPDYLPAREQLAYAALLGGFNVCNASTCLPHRIQQAMGSIEAVHGSHAQGLACVYPQWLERVVPHVKDKVRDMEAYLKINDFVAFVCQFIETFGLKTTLSRMGYSAAHLPMIREQITGNIDNDPLCHVDQGIIEQIILASYHGD